MFSTFWTLLDKKNWASRGETLSRQGVGSLTQYRFQTCEMTQQAEARAVEGNQVLFWNTLGPELGFTICKMEVLCYYGDACERTFPQWWPLPWVTVTSKSSLQLHLLHRKGEKNPYEVPLLGLTLDGSSWILNLGLWAMFIQTATESVFFLCTKSLWVLIGDKHGILFREKTSQNIQPGFQGALQRCIIPRGGQIYRLYQVERAISFQPGPTWNQAI